MTPSTLRVLCRPGLVQGFGLAGVAAVPVPLSADPGAAIEAALLQDQAGVLLVEEAVYDRVPPEARARFDRMAKPVIVPFPGAAWDGGRPADERVVELLRRAIGYRVRLS